MFENITQIMKNKIIFLMIPSGEERKAKAQAPKDKSKRRKGKSKKQQCNLSCSQ